MDDVKRFVKNDRFAEHLGVNMLEYGNGRAKATMAIQDHHLNSAGTVHGGAIFALAEFMALASTGLAAGRRITVLVGAHQHGHLAFNRAQFLEFCADNRGLNMRAFEDANTADAWLNATNEIVGEVFGQMSGDRDAPLSVPMQRFFTSVMA